MKQLITLLVLAIISATTVNGQVKFQDDKNYHPFASFAINPRFGNDGTATGIEAGILNKNTLFKLGIGFGGWERSNDILLAGVSRRLFRVGRFEEWGVLSTAQTITHRIPFNLAPQFITKYQFDKACYFYAGVGAHFIVKDPKWTEAQLTMGVAVTFRGRVFKPY